MLQYPPRVVAAARVGGAHGTPAREKGFPSNLLLNLIDMSALFK
jgi:hypothetical protein